MDNNTKYVEGSSESKRTKKKPVIITILSVLAVALIVGLIIILVQCSKEKYEYPNEEKYRIGDFDQTIIVSSVDIEWIGGSVEVVFARQANFYCTEDSEAVLSDDATMRTWFDGETLRIRPCASGTKLEKIPEKALTVYVPAENLFFNDLQISTDSASVKVDQVGASFFTVNTVSGNITVNQVSDSRDVRIKSDSGNVSYTHVIGKSESTEITTSGGNITMSEVTIPGSLTATSATGHIELTLPEESSFVLDYMSNTGIISNGGFNGIVKDGKFVVGQGGANISLKSDSGNVILKKRK